MQVVVNEKSEGGEESNMSTKYSVEEKVYKIKLELDILGEELDILREYGRAENGITRTVLVPSSMQLNRLNYVIQKCFGWQNSHLQHFMLNEDTFSELTNGGKLDEWKKHAGKYFRCYDTMSDDYDVYYLDDYDGDAVLRHGKEESAVMITTTTPKVKK